MKPSPAVSRGSAWARQSSACVSIDSEQTQDDFQEELIELFGQEAQGVARSDPFSATELEGQPDLERYAQLVDVIVRGITSLGRLCGHDQSSRCGTDHLRAASLIDTIERSDDGRRARFQYGT